MFYSFKILFYNIIQFYKDITEKACLVVLHGLAGANGSRYIIYRRAQRVKVAL
jgi:hypothetical protein